MGLRIDEGSSTRADCEGRSHRGERAGRAGLRPVSAARASCAGCRSSRREGTHVIHVDDLQVRVARKSIKTLRMRVSPADGQVQVSAPLHVSEARIAAFVREKRSWIDARRVEAATSVAGRAANATPEEIAQWRAVVESFVPLLVEKWEPVMGVRAGKLVYRNMTSRWGSCQPSTGRICINVRLALYPPECLEYVVVHELCHLIERGHGPAFQAAMDRFLPDWRERRAKLR